MHDMKKAGSTSIPQPRPSIVAAITKGECRGTSVTVDRDDLVDLIRNLRSRSPNTEDQLNDPSTITIGRQPIGDNHLFIGNADRTLSNVHVSVTPIEEDSLKISNVGRVQVITLITGAIQQCLAPGESCQVVLPVDIVLGNPASTITIRHEDPCPTIADGPSAWQQLTAEQRQHDNEAISQCNGVGMAEFSSILKRCFDADTIVIANRESIIATTQSGTVDDHDRLHLWRWYAFNGRAYSLLRNLTAISLADGQSSLIGNGIVFRLFQGGTYIHVLRRNSPYSTIDRERLTRIAWYVLGLNANHQEWYPTMHLEDCEPMHIDRLVARMARQAPEAFSRGSAESMQNIAPRIAHDTGILFPRRSRKPLSANAGLDIPRRHSAVAQASKNRYYHRLTDMLELFITDRAMGTAPLTNM